MSAGNQAAAVVYQYANLGLPAIAGQSADSCCEFGIIEGGAEDEATDPAKSVDGDFHRRFMMTGTGEGKRRSVNFF